MARAVWPNANNIDIRTKKTVCGQWQRRYCNYNSHVHSACDNDARRGSRKAGVRCRAVRIPQSLPSSRVSRPTTSDLEWRMLPWRRRVVADHEDISHSDSCHWYTQSRRRCWRQQLWRRRRPVECTCCIGSREEVSNIIGNNTNITSTKTSAISARATSSSNGSH